MPQTTGMAKYSEREAVLISKTQLAALEKIRAELGTPRAALIRAGVQMVIDKRLADLEALHLGAELLAGRGVQ